MAVLPWRRLFATAKAGSGTPIHWLQFAARGQIEAGGRQTAGLSERLRRNASRLASFLHEAKQRRLAIVP
jgi:hypothetical protein